jgi:hypothetical protein
MDCIGLSRFGTGRHGCWLVVLFLCFAGGTLAAAPEPARGGGGTAASLPRPAPDGHRFLFVVDISLGMRATDSANRQALFEMLFTGLDGQMRTGDTFGLWLYNDKLHAGDFPMQIWDGKDPLAGATLATKYLREQTYAGRSRPNVLMPPLQNLIKGVGDVNVLVISHCKPALEGTPFDTNIAAIVRRKRLDREQAQKPFITALVARGGTIVTGAVVIPGEPMLLPQRPPSVLAAKATNSPVQPVQTAKPKGVLHSLSGAEARIQGSELRSAGVDPATRNPKPGAVTSNPEPEAANPGPPQPAAPHPKVLEIVTRPNVATNTVAAVEPPVQSPTTNPSLAIISAAATPIVAAPPTPANATKPQNPGAAGLSSAAQPGTAASRLDSGIATANLEPRLPSAGTAPGFSTTAIVTSLARALEPEPLPVAAREPGANDRTPATVAVVAPAPGPSAMLLLTIGIVLLAACVGLLVLVLRRLRPRQQGSFISRSMELR